MLADIRVARAIDLRIADADGDSLTLAHRLNRTSTTRAARSAAARQLSLLTLAGWSLLSLRLRIAGELRRIRSDSRLRYLAPVWGDLRATARRDGEDWKASSVCWLRAARAACACSPRVPGENGAAATTLEARFVALRRGKPRRGVNANALPATVIALRHNRAGSPDPETRIRRWIFLPLLALRCCRHGRGGRKREKMLDSTLAEYAATLRWGNFEAGMAYIDPALIAERPVSSLELERYRQVRVSCHHPQDPVPVGKEQVRVVAKSASSTNTARASVS